MGDPQVLDAAPDLRLIPETVSWRDNDGLSEQRGSAEQLEDQDPCGELLRGVHTIRKFASTLIR